MKTLNREQKRIIERYMNKSFEALDIEVLLQNLVNIIEEQEPNIIFLTDAYKYSHHKFYDPKLTKMGSYLESRGGFFSSTMFFGLQYIMKKYLCGKVLSMKMIEEAYEKLSGSNGVFSTKDVFSKEKWIRLLEKHDGILPIRIKAVKEGAVVNTKNILMMIENTDPEFPWITNFLESLVLEIWYPITVATLSREVKKIVLKYLKETGCNPEYIDITAEFILNDFGFRGVSSVESASIGGAAHLINFMGSDNVIGSDMITKYYNTNIMYGKSIPATEHSICTLKGENGELEIFRNVLISYPTGIVACVSDSFDIFRACAQYWGTELKDLVLSRDGVLVIRPDSGDPMRTLKEVFTILFDKFGYTINEKGFKVLPKQVRVIQGDGVNYNSIIKIYEMLFENKIAAENLVLGMGGKLLQSGIDRDLNNFAIKACYGVLDGEEIEIVKSPVEMDKDGNISVSFKKSKKGDMKLVKTDDNYKTVMKNEVSEEEYNNLKDELEIVFENGLLFKEYTFEEIRENAKIK